MMSPESQHKVTLFFLATCQKVFEITGYTLEGVNTNKLVLEPKQRAQIFNRYINLIESEDEDILMKYCNQIVAELEANKPTIDEEGKNLS